MSLFQILKELWATYLETGDRDLKGAIEHTEKQLRQTSEGRQQLDRFYEESYPDMLVVEEEE